MTKRDVTLPPVHNTRSPEQWRIISEHVEFDGKMVLDLGCGYGDLLWRAWDAGSDSILGVESDTEIQRAIGDIAHEFGTMVVSYRDRIEDHTGAAALGHRQYDIIICFSVLPYLTDPTATLHWIHQHSTQALIECQLAGDGPGFDWLKGPQDMRRWLDSIGWERVERIGETVIEDRGCKRGIWLCSK